MSSQQDPSRLIDELGDAEAERELRRGLTAFTARRPSAESLARMSAVLTLDSLAAPQSPSALNEPSATPAAAGSAKPALWIAGGTAVAGGIVLAVLALRAPSEAPPSAPTVAAVAPTTATATPSETAPPVAPAPPGAARDVAGAKTSVEPAPSAPLGADVAPVPAPEGAPEALQPEPPSPVSPAPSPTSPVANERATAATPPSRPASTAANASARAPAATPPAAPGITETQILRDARLVLDRDPRSALALSEQHRRDYPSGVFVQERELIAITALVKLGRRGEAEERAARFRSRFPASPYKARLDKIVP